MARRDNKTCGAYGGRCQQPDNHTGPCNGAPAVKAICGEYTDDGTYCQKSPGHSGNCE